MSETRKSPTHLAVGKPADADDLIIRRRHKLVMDRISDHGDVLLDFGCGNGAQSFLFADDFGTTVGVDIGEASLKAFAEESSRKEYGGRIVPVLYDGDALPIADATVDCAVSFEVLEHVRNEDVALTELRRVIRPGGLLAMSVPNRWWIFETHGAALPLLPWNRVPLLSWLPKRIHDRYARARIYRRREIVAKIQDFDFTVLQSCYITAPMDVLKWRPAQKLMRATIFRGDTTPFPFLSTAILVIARRNAQ